jgi:hypothetical protein
MLVALDLGLPNKMGSIFIPRSGGSLFGALRSGNGECASLSSTAPTPGHLLQRFEKVDKLPIRKRTEGSGFMGANKAPAIWDKAVHRRSDSRMKVSAGVDAIILRKTGNILDLLCSGSHNLAANYTPNQDAI